MNPELDGERGDESLPQIIIPKSLDKRRWQVLLVFSLALFLNGEVWMTYETVNAQTQQYFGIGDTLVRNFFTVFLIAYSITAVPCVILPQVIGYRKTLLFGCFFNLLGTICRITIIPIIDRSRKAAYGLALVGNISCGMAMAFVFSLPTLISSIWFSEKETSLSTSIPFMGNSFGVGVGYLDIFLLMKNSQDSVKINSSFRYIFIFEALISSFTFILSVFFVPSAPNRPVDLIETRQTENQEKKGAWTLTVDTIKIIKKALKIRAVQLGLLIFTLNYGNYMIIFVFLADIVTYYSINESSITGYIGAVGVILGAVNTLVVGILMNKAGSGNYKIFAMAVNLLSALTLSVILLTIGVSKFNNISSAVLFIISLSLCPIYMTVGSEILARVSSPIDPNLSSSPAFIFGNIYGAVIPVLLALIPSSFRYLVVMSYCLASYLLCATLVSLKISDRT